MAVIISDIVLAIDGTEHRLSLAQAYELRDVLNGLLGASVPWPEVIGRIIERPYGPAMPWRTPYWEVSTIRTRAGTGADAVHIRSVYRRIEE